jgi:transaldolase
MRVTEGAREALERLRRAGFRLIVVSNQPDVARGTTTRAEVEALNDVLRQALPTDEFSVCYHDDGDACDCRKPRPGLLRSAAGRHNIDLTTSFMVGDRWRDIDAGRAAGCRTVLIDHHYSETIPNEPDYRATTITDAADWILTQAREHLVTPIEQLNVKVFADGADKGGIMEMAANPVIKGFTTNPTLMRKAGISDYRAFAKDVLSAITNRPISFEVFADDVSEMKRQAFEIASWGANVYVKIPVTNTRRESTAALVRELSHAGVKVNVTALMTLGQVRTMTDALAGGAPSNISVFAGRIADTGRDPVPLMRDVVTMVAPHPSIEIIWASPRELLNIYHAEAVGCHIITVTNDTLKKLGLIGKDLDAYSLETVQMFFDDGRKASYTL